MSNCPYCSTPIVGGQEFVICPNDKALHHAECWKQNGNHCANFQCSGVGELPFHTIGKTAVKNAQATTAKLPTITFPSLPKFSTPTNGRQLVLQALGSVMGMGAWTGLAIFVSAVMNSFAPFKLNQLVIVLIACLFGLWKGVRAPLQEIPRCIFVFVGWFIFRAIGTLIIDLSHIEIEVKDFLALYFSLVPVTTLMGAVGALIGGFWVDTRSYLMRSMLGILLGYLFLPYFQIIWASNISDDNFNLIVRLIILFGFAFIPAVLKISSLFLGGGIISAAFGLAVVVISYDSILKPINPYLPIVVLVVNFAGSVQVIKRNHSRLNHTHPTIQDAFRVVQLGLLGFGVTSFGLSTSLLAGHIIKPYLDMILSNALPTNFIMWLFADTFHQPANILYAFFGKYWNVFLIFYCSFYALNTIINRDGFLKTVHRAIRFISLLFLCITLAYALEQTLEFILNTWTIYTWFSKYLLASGNYLAASSIVIGILYTIACFKDTIPFWAIAVHFVIWFSQILVFVLFAVPILGLLGIGLGNIYASLFSNVPDVIFGLWTLQEGSALIGTYAGLFAGAGFWLAKGARGDLGWIPSKAREFSLSVFTKVYDMQEKALAQYKWWQITLLSVVSAFFLYFIVVIEVVK